MLDCLSGNVRTEGLVEALLSVLMIRLLGDKTRKEILWNLTIHVGTPSCGNLMLRSANSRFDSLTDFRLSSIITKI